MIENPETGDRKEMNCERFDTQKNCKPITIVSKASDFQVVLRDKNGNEINPVGLTSNTAKANQSKVHTAEIYVTVRSPNELLKKIMLSKLQIIRDLPVEILQKMINI